MQYNQSTDLQALLDQQKDNQQTSFTVDNAYTFDVKDFVGQVEQDYNTKLAQAQAEAQTLGRPGGGGGPAGPAGCRCR